MSARSCDHELGELAVCVGAVLRNMGRCVLWVLIACELAVQALISALLILVSPALRNMSTKSARHLAVSKLRVSTESAVSAAACALWSSVLAKGFCTTGCVYTNVAVKAYSRRLQPICVLKRSHQATADTHTGALVYYITWEDAQVH